MTCGATCAGGLMLVVQDLTTCEETESMTVQPGQDTSDSDINPGNVLQGVHAIFSLGHFASPR